MIITEEYILYMQVYDIEILPCIEKADSKFIKRPILPQVKETHFKIIHKVYPVAEFLKGSFKFEVEPCSLCSISDESLEHLFHFCPAY